MPLKCIIVTQENFEQYIVTSDDDIDRPVGRETQVIPRTPTLDNQVCSIHLEDILYLLQEKHIILQEELEHDPVVRDKKLGRAAEQGNQGLLQQATLGAQVHSIRSYNILWL